jgi:hypothetical protein
LQQDTAVRLPRLPVTLSQLGPIAQGQDRAIYFHPDYPDVLFKLLLPPDQITLRGFRGWSLKRFPGTRARAFFKEYEASTSIFMQGTASAGDNPVTRLFGYIQTDLGPASIVERIAVDGSTVGPTLGQVVQSRALDQTQVDLLNDFAARILHWQVRTTDMNTKNIVFGVRNTRPQFVLVDGIGDNFTLPLRTWSRWVMRKGQSESFGKIARRLRLNWSEANWRFDRPA